MTDKDIIIGKQEGEIKLKAMKMTKEFNLSEKIYNIDVSHAPFTRVKDVREFIKWCDEHSFTTNEGLRVIDINKLKEGAGEELR